MRSLDQSTRHDSVMCRILPVQGEIQTAQGGIHAVQPQIHVPILCCSVRCQVDSVFSHMHAIQCASRRAGQGASRCAKQLTNPRCKPRCNQWCDLPSPILEVDLVLLDAGPHQIEPTRSAHNQQQKRHIRLGWIVRLAKSIRFDSVLAQVMAVQGGTQSVQSKSSRFDSVLPGSGPDRPGSARFDSVLGYVHAIRGATQCAQVQTEEQTKVQSKVQSKLRAIMESMVLSAH